MLVSEHVKLSMVGIIHLAFQFVINSQYGLQNPLILNLVKNDALAANGRNSKNQTKKNQN